MVSMALLYPEPDLTLQHKKHLLLEKCTTGKSEWYFWKVSEVTRLRERSNII